MYMLECTNKLHNLISLPIGLLQAFISQPQLSIFIQSMDVSGPKNRMTEFNTYLYHLTDLNKNKRHMISPVNFLKGGNIKIQFHTFPECRVLVNRNRG